MGDLGNWAAQITQQAWRYRSLVTGGLANYLGPDSNSLFVDTASTALMAAATYRIAQYGIDDSMVRQLQVLFNRINQSCSTDPIC